MCYCVYLIEDGEDAGVSMQVMIKGAQCVIVITSLRTEKTLVCPCRS